MILAAITARDIFWHAGVYTLALVLGMWSAVLRMKETWAAEIVFGLACGCVLTGLIVP